MTTAARPTYAPARGGTGKAESDLGAMSKQYSSRDLPAHTKLKYRQDGQGTSSDLKNRDFRKELEERERSGRDKSRSDRNRESGTSSSSTSSSKRPRIEQQIPVNLDADDPVDDDDEDDDDDDDDDDDTAELLAELAKIKKERAAEAAQKEADRKAEEEKIRMENILKGNPLITNLQEKQSGDFTVKRRWDDDVVFKNCARGESDRKERRFINDTLRSEFHKKFMDKYIK